MPLKLFVGDGSVWTADPASLNPVLAFHWDGIMMEERRRGGRNPLSPFALVADPGAADLHVLGYEWNHYIWTDAIADAQQHGACAAQHGRQILVWHSGDLPPIIPIPNARAVQAALYRSRLRPNQVAAPSFIRDPIQHYAGGHLTPRPKRDRPVVGFCGYAGIVPLKIAYGICHALRHNLLARIGRARYEAMPVVPATVLRARALRTLAADRRVETNFSINARAFKKHDSRTDPETRDRQRLAFFRNVHDSDYTVCIRGYGNWSHRFYETLACGRIPVFIDTDCVLPGGGDIDWKKYCVWIERDDVPRIADRVLEFHGRLDRRAFAAHQRACRRLWEERLSTAGFMTHLAEQLELDVCAA